MKIAHSFVVPVSVDEAWDVLLDLERVAPCMPGATLESFDGESFTSSVKVKLGALTMTYKGTGRFLYRDAENRRVGFEAKGREARGAGTASATVEAALFPDDAGTRVDVETDLAISGRAAQFGRGVFNDVAAQLLDQFAASLAAEVTGAPDAPANAAEPAVSTEAAPTPAAPRAARPAAEPIDLLAVSRGALLNRALAPAATIVGVLILALLLRRCGAKKSRS